MKRLLIILAVLVGLAVGSTTARAQSCGEMDVDAAARRAGELTTLLKIANFRADVKYMG
jgi:hypothetical protein